MIDGYLVPLVVAAAVGAGVIGGVLYAFSVMVMRPLASLPPQHGIAAMQAVNADALRPPFLGVFVGTALLSAAVVVGSLFDWSDASPYVLAGGLLYLAGAFVLTMAYHVPRNEALVRLDPAGATAPDHWSRYVREWTTWNHVRALAAIAAAVLLTIALTVD
jgi:uncharacterized membrane protein